MKSITVEEAAKIMGKPPQFVREALKQQRLPIGVAVRMPGGRWSYYITEEKLMDWLKSGRE